jgi:hypothetical protein
LKAPPPPDNLGIDIIFLVLFKNGIGISGTGFLEQAPDTCNKIRKVLDI